MGVMKGFWMGERISAKGAVTRFNRIAESVVPSLEGAWPTEEGVAFRPMILKESSAAFNCATGSSRSKSDKERFLPAAQNSQAVNKARSERENRVRPVCAAVTSSSITVLVALS